MQASTQKLTIAEAAPGKPAGPNQPTNNNSNSSNNQTSGPPATKKSGGQQQKVLDPTQMHMCRLCDKLLSSSSSLDRHMLTHSGERPFVCKRCHMTFTTNGNMHRHMRTHLHKDSLARQQAEQMQLKQSLLAAGGAAPISSGAQSSAQVVSQLLANGSLGQAPLNGNNPQQQIISALAPQSVGPSSACADPLGLAPLDNPNSAHYQLLQHLHQQQQLQPNLELLSSLRPQSNQSSGASLLNQQLLAAFQQQQQQQHQRANNLANPNHLQQQLDISVAAAAAAAAPFAGFGLDHSSQAMMTDQLDTKSLMLSALTQATADPNQAAANGLDLVKAVMLAAAAAAAAAAAVSQKQAGNLPEDNNNLAHFSTGNDLLMESPDAAAAPTSAGSSTHSMRGGKRRKQVRPSRSHASDETSELAGGNLSPSTSFLDSPASSSSAASLGSCPSRDSAMSRARKAAPSGARASEERERVKSHVKIKADFESEMEGEDDEDAMVASEQLVRQMKDSISGHEDVNNNEEERSSLERGGPGAGSLRRRHRAAPPTRQPHHHHPSTIQANSINEHSQLSTDDEHSRASTISNASSMGAISDNQPRQPSSFVSSSHEIEQSALESADDLDEQSNERIEPNRNRHHHHHHHHQHHHQQQQHQHHQRKQHQQQQQLKQHQQDKNNFNNNLQADSEQQQFTSISENDIIEDVSQSYVKTANPNATRKGGKRNRHCYKCKLCTYSSVDRCTLVRHLRIHSGERPYICGICRYAFTTKANCERHVRKRHKKQYNSLGGSGGVKGSNGGGRSLIITDHSNHQTIPVKVNPVAAQTISQTLQRIQDNQLDDEQDSSEQQQQQHLQSPLGGRNPFDVSFTSLDLMAAQQALDLSCKLRSSH